MFFWEPFEVLSCFEGTILQEKEEQLLRFSFQQLKREVFINVAGPKCFKTFIYEQYWIPIF